MPAPGISSTRTFRAAPHRRTTTKACRWASTSPRPRPARAGQRRDEQRRVPARAQVAVNCISHGVRRFAGSGVALLGLLFAAPTTAHLKIVQGRLIDLVQRSDVIVIGTISGERPASPQTADVVVHVDRVLAGKLNASTVAARSAADFAPTMRDVLFLRRVGSGWESIAPAGTVFPTQPHDDAAYRQTITAICRGTR